MNTFKSKEFQSLRHLKLKLYDYVNWFNKHRIQGTLEYMTTIQYRHTALKKAVSFTVNNPNVLVKT
ncbi:IS3 family transposase [Paenibacillus filicis]|uniref:IS3 family transposase n=1 Tax=Paenibacillus filicis TaxID=669464 RepID=UPI003BF97C3B